MPVQSTMAMMMTMRQKPAAPECAKSEEKPELGQVESAQHDQQRQQRQRDDAVGEAHQHRIEFAAEIAGTDADRGARSRRRPTVASRPDEKRNLPAHHQPHQFVAPGLVGAEPMLRRRRIVARQQVGGVGVDAAMKCCIGNAASANNTSSSQNHQARHPRRDARGSDDSAVAIPKPRASAGVVQGDRGGAHFRVIRGSSQP